MRQALIAFVFAGLTLPAVALAQGGGKKPTTDDLLDAIDSPTFVPTVRVGKVMDQGDSILYMEMNNVYVYPKLTFKDQRQMAAYMRLVRNVKKVLPIAKEGIVQEYKPRMKKLTYSQGKLLIKLIYRECNSSSYDIVKAFLGPIRAGFWQAFSAIFGASLRKEYDPEGTDRLTERVVLMVEAGQI